MKISCLRIKASVVVGTSMDKMFQDARELSEKLGVVVEVEDHLFYPDGIFEAPSNKSLEEENQMLRDAVANMGGLTALGKQNPGLAWSLHLRNVKK